MQVKFSLKLLDATVLPHEAIMVKGVITAVSFRQTLTAHCKMPWGCSVPFRTGCRFPCSHRSERCVTGGSAYLSIDSSFCGLISLQTHITLLILFGHTEASSRSRSTTSSSSIQEMIGTMEIVGMTAPQIILNLVKSTYEMLSGSNQFRF